MEIREALNRDFNIGDVLELKNISSSTACYLVLTPCGSYVFKHVGRSDFVQIHDKIQSVLAENGFVQGRVIRASSGELMTQTGYSLFEFIPGQTHSKLDDEQFRTTIEYLYGYNQALRQVPFAPKEIWELNNWDRVRSVPFLCDNAERLIAQAQMDEQARQLLRQATRILAVNLSFFQNNSKQLLHSDIGPDNIVFSGVKVNAIIDFTPEYENELYSLAQFLFWNCLWKYEGENSLRRTRSALRYYYATGEQACHREALFLYLVKACLFRIMGPALTMLDNGFFDQSRIQLRLQALHILLSRKDII